MTSRDNVRVDPGETAQGEIEIVEEHRIWSGDTAQLYNDLVRFPEHEGRAAEQRQFRLRRGPTHDDGVVTVPIREDGRIILIRQFRHAARMWLRELPRGGRKFGESVEDAARREIREEIGYETLSTFDLGRVSPDGGQLETVPHIVGARVRRSGSPEQEDTEAIDRILVYTYADLRVACERSDIIDAYTLAATLRLASCYADGVFKAPGPLP